MSKTGLENFQFTPLVPASPAPYTAGIIALIRCIRIAKLFATASQEGICQLILPPPSGPGFPWSKLPCTFRHLLHGQEPCRCCPRAGVTWAGERSLSHCIRRAMVRRLLPLAWRGKQSERRSYQVPLTKNGLDCLLSLRRLSSSGSLLDLALAVVGRAVADLLVRPISRRSA